MPAQRKTLQAQGVPIPDKLPARSNRFSTPAKSEQPKRIRRQVVTERTRNAETGLAQETHTTYEAPREFAPSRGGGLSGNSRKNPLDGARSSSGIGLLAAEFFICLILLVLQFFGGGTTGLPDRIMAVIKRGTLICAAFFILSLVSGAGESANKISKAFGALIVVAILLTTPIFGTDSSGNPSGVLADIDELIKNEWAPTNVHTTAPSASPAGTTPASTPATPGGAIRTLTESELSKLIHAGVGTPAYNAVTAELRAFKSGQVWKVPGDAIVGLEDIGTHGIAKAGGILKDILGAIGIHL